MGAARKLLVLLESQMAPRGGETRMCGRREGGKVEGSVGRSVSRNWVFVSRAESDNKTIRVHLSGPNAIEVKMS